MDDAAWKSDVKAEEMVRVIETDPCGAAKSILGSGHWEAALDYKVPLSEDSARSALYALNGIGILMGAADLENWHVGGFTK